MIQHTLLPTNFEPVYIEPIIHDPPWASIDEAEKELVFVRKLPRSQRDYQDSLDCELAKDSCTWVEAEQAFREGFLAAAESAVDLSTSDGDESLADLSAMAAERRYRAREAASCGTHYEWFIVGHEIAAARLRGEHHALTFISDYLSLEIDADESLATWLLEVERWYRSPLWPVVSPSRPLVAVMRGGAA